MRQIDLREYQESGPHRLSVPERDALRGAIPHLTITPVDGESDRYNIRPASHVGAVEVDGLSVLIEPKIGIPQLLSLACYALGAYRLQEGMPFDFEEHHSLPEALALALGSAARRAFSRGLLHGHVPVEEALHTVRGRIRFDEQMRRRFGMPLPVEVGYDEFTDDVLANRLVKAAAHRLRSLRMRSAAARRHLGWIAGTLDNVSLVEYRPKDVPECPTDRLSHHYRDVIALSRLILRHGFFESGRGDVRAAGYLMDMNVVFQEFVTVALQEALRVSPRNFGEENGFDSLGVGGRVRLRPDLVWRDGGGIRFVGDAKYKNLEAGSVPHADLYQLLAYVTALGLPGGMLIYAKGESQRRDYIVRGVGKRLIIETVDVAQPLADVLG